jgi:hypothetical protein
MEKDLIRQQIIVVIVKAKAIINGYYDKLDNSRKL